jgi:hypothetical protein
MSRMKRSSIIVGMALTMLVHGAAAQLIIPPGGPPFNPLPPPPPLPPPRIEVPAIPKLDAPPRQTYQAPAQPSFGDRVSRCLDEAAAAGLDPAERSAYSRACANR